MKRLILTGLFIVFLLIGCTSPVKDDLFNYVNMELPSIIPMEEEALSEYENVISKNDYTYEELYETLKEKIIPTYSNFVQSLEGISPTTDEVKEVHVYYIKGAKKQLEALIILKEGLEEKDENKINTVNNLIKESEEYMNTFTTMIISLANKYNIKYELQ